MTLDEVDLLDELEKILCSHKSLSSEEKDKLRQHGFIFSIGRALYNLSKENDDLRKRNQQLMDQMEEQAEVVDHDGDGSGTASGWDFGDGSGKASGWRHNFREGRGEGNSSGCSYTGLSYTDGDSAGWRLGRGDGYADGAGWGDGDGTSENDCHLDLHLNRVCGDGSGTNDE